MQVGCGTLIPSSSVRLAYTRVGYKFPYISFANQYTKWMLESKVDQTLYVAAPKVKCASEGRFGPIAAYVDGQYGVVLRGLLLFIA